MIELFTITQVAAIFDLPPARVRYWIQRGIFTPSVRRKGRFLYTFGDVIAVKVATELFRRDADADTIRKRLQELRTNLPDPLPKTALLKVICDGKELSVAEAGSPEGKVGPILCAFSTESLRKQIQTSIEAMNSAPQVVMDGPTTPHKQPNAYQCFARACDAEEAGSLETAEVYYERCLALEESFAAARTNLGNIYYRRGDYNAARIAYEAALKFEPEQAEARYNLGNLLDDAGETEQAIAELRRVVTRAPEFADAHFNLGVFLARVGGFTQARKHFSQYLELDESSGWASRAKEILATLKLAPVATA